MTQMMTSLFDQPVACHTFSSVSEGDELACRVSVKLEGVVCLASSEDSIADINETTIFALQNKHPTPFHMYATASLFLRIRTHSQG